MLQHLFLWTGAVIVPSEFEYIYSTYIFLLCLYLIYQRDRLEQEMKLLFFIFMHLICVYMYQKFNELVNSIVFICDRLVAIEHFLISIKSGIDNAFWQFESWRFSRALLFGAKNHIDQSEKWVIQAVGVGHLFVVSGLHVGFLYALLRMLIRWCWCVIPSQWLIYVPSKKILEVGVGSILIVGYGLLIGWAPAISRASIMLLVWNVVHAFHYSVRVSKLLWIAFISIVILDLDSVYLPSLWLSFVLVFLIVHMSRVPLSLIYRLGGIQVVLSVGALIMIAGWQDYISIYTMLINFLMIPFTAFFWFPVGFFAVIESMLFDSYFLMTIVDTVVLFVFELLKITVFDYPLLKLNQILPMLFKVLAILPLAFSVLFFNWRSFCITLSMVLTFLLIGTNTFLTPFTFCSWGNLLCPSQVIMLKNDNNDVVLLAKDLRHASKEKREWRKSSTGWFSGKYELDDYVNRFMLLDNSVVFLLWPDAQEKLTSNVLFAVSPDVVVFSLVPSEKLKSRLEALKVGWLVIGLNQNLILEEYSDSIDIRFSECHFLSLSEDQTLCKRVEIFENMIN
ncbi:ComEC/Rec2 family competence protein [Marinomonas sp. 2405UD68-3]|uniref:ComEC/Rec2 family competence protein n=1 Tax=Marinomonas sp. 2405UD68-3 TaxID=3391835 RepID=UPI0039C9B896